MRVVIGGLALEAKSAWWDNYESHRLPGTPAYVENAPAEAFLLILAVLPYPERETDGCFGAAFAVSDPASRQAGWAGARGVEWI